MNGRVSSTKTERIRRVDLSDALVEALFDLRRTRREKWLKDGKGEIPEWVSLAYVKDQLGDQLLEQLLPQLLYVKAVAILDDAIDLWLSEKWTSVESSELLLPDLYLDFWPLTSLVFPITRSHFHKRLGQ